MSIYKVITLLCLLVSYTYTVAQSEKLQTENKYRYKLTDDAAKTIYHQNFYNEFEYLNGKEYKPYHHPNHSNPYLNSKVGIGSLYINGKSYSDLLLIYDIHDDELIHIANHIALTQYYIKLKKEAIDSFSITQDNNSIVLHRVEFDAEMETGMKDGFYEIENFDRMSLYYKHTALLTRKLGYDEYIYSQKKYLYIRNTYYLIQSKRQFLTLFPEKKKEIRNEIRSMPNTFRHFSISQMIQILQFIESLKNR